MSIEQFKELPILGIIRGISEDSLYGCIEAAMDGGLNTIEITMNTKNAESIIKKTAYEFPDLYLGAGTVTSVKRLESALEAGAKYIVMPHTSEKLTSICKKNNIPFFCGALTPTEVHKAWELGSTMVKVFPVRSLGGYSYIKDLKGPFNDIKMLACGGVNPDNLSDYINAGTDAIAIGSQIFKEEWMNSKNYNKIKTSAQNFISKLKELI